MKENNLSFSVQLKCVRIDLCVFPCNTPAGRLDCSSFSPVNTCTTFCLLTIFINVQNPSSGQRRQPRKTYCKHVHEVYLSSKCHRSFSDILNLRGTCTLTNYSFSSCISAFDKSNFHPHKYSPVWMHKLYVKLY